MSLSRKELKGLKADLAKKNPAGLQKIKNRNSSSKAVKKKIKKSENFVKKKNLIRWNFVQNQLVSFRPESGPFFEDKIGLLVSDFQYFSSTVEKNCFFVLVDNRVIQIDGRYLKSI